MHFLIVNDDGITSPFLPILTQAVKRAGQEAKPRPVSFLPHYFSGGYQNGYHCCCC